MRDAEPEPDDEGPWLSPRVAFVLVVVAALLVRMFVPFGRELLYPLTLFATWVHEMGHGLSGLAVGGTFESLEVYWNASGLARGAVAGGGPTALRAIGGLLAPPLVGAAILAFARGPRRASLVLWVLATAMAISVPIWVRSLTGFVVVPLLALAFGALAYKGSDAWRHLGAQLLGVTLGLDTISRIDYLFTGEVHVGGQDLPSDVAHVAAALGGHYLLWGALLALASLALVAAGVRVAWMEPVPVPRLLPRRRAAAGAPR
ncbi:MAG: M50 family metallopeptidase [Sandaracinaceae bacterium]|nr:M50 family metallopeptidase [Sandaracinaceae bacterium]